MIESGTKWKCVSNFVDIFCAIIDLNNLAADFARKGLDGKPERANYNNNSALLKNKTFKNTPTASFTQIVPVIYLK